MSGTPIFDSMKTPDSFGKPVESPLGPTPEPKTPLSQAEFDKIIGRAKAQSVTRGMNQPKK
jgi:hypothetical protein